MVERKRRPSFVTLSFDSPTRSRYGMATSTTLMPSCTARVLITGVRLRPSGSGDSNSSVGRLKTRMPLALSVTTVRPTSVSRAAKNLLPSRRTAGISVSAPAMREPMTRSVPARRGAAQQRNCSGRYISVGVEEPDDVVRRRENPS
jgi:hypothetical protein